MARFLHHRSVDSAPRCAVVAPAAAMLWLIVGCVDLTPPWEKGGTGGRIGTGGVVTTGGELDAAMGGEGGTGGVGGVGGAIDAPLGGGGAMDARIGGAGGRDGASVDGPLGGSGGSATDLDGGIDAPSGGAGGGGGATNTGGAGGSGGSKDGGAGTTATGGTTTGGATSTGGARDGGAGTTATGGTTSTGGATTPDGGHDTPPDTSALLTGLVAYYTFESTTSTTVPDNSGKGNNGTLSIGVSDGGTTGTGYELVTGKVGKGLALHKAGLGYVRVPTAVFASTTALTISLWVNIATSQDWQRIVDVGINANIPRNTRTNTKYLNLVPKNDASNMLFSITTNGFSNEQQLSTSNLSTSTWTHLAVVLAPGGGGTLYVNGTEAVTSASVALRPTDLGAIDYAYLGKSQFEADPYFDGIIDEFRVYNRALTAAEVQALRDFTGP